MKTQFFLKKSFPEGSIYWILQRILVVIKERRWPQISIRNMFLRNNYIRPFVKINKAEYYSNQYDHPTKNILTPFIDFEEYIKYRKGLVSVIITSYNVEKYIKLAIDSIINQSYQDFEIIIVDDASTDKTVQIVEEYNDPRIILFHNKINCGTYYSKNFGIQQAEGEFIAIQDSDDFSDKFRLEKQVTYLYNNPECVMVKSQYVRVDVQGVILMHPRIGFATSLIRRILFDVIGYYDSVRVAADDEYDCRVKAIFGKNAIGKINAVLYFALDRGDSLQYMIKIKSDTRKSYIKSYRNWHKKLASEKRIEYLPFPLMRRPFLIPDRLRHEIKPQTLPEINISRIKLKADKTYATLASIPQRKHHLSLVINSVINQFDRIYVYLNNYEEVPDFLDHTKITVVRSQDFGDLADNGKFFWCSEIDGYHFTLDDDIIYPENYVIKLTEKIRKYQFRAIVGVHGIILNHRKFKSYYDPDSRLVFNFIHRLKNDTVVDILGTGTMAYHTSAIRFSLDKFEDTRMADIYVSIHASEHNIQMIAVERSHQWLINSLSKDTESIYDQFVKNDIVQTELVRKYLLKTI